MRVRNLTLLECEYLGRWTEAADRECPCKPCYHPHDYGGPVTIYSKGGKRHVEHETKMRCRTRECGRCPDPEPTPIHKPPASKRAAQRCKRCGAAL
jgi:hypothetical protein